jgi:hypothetical protein
MKPSELYALARDVYSYISTNQLVSRGVMNSHFHTSSDDRRNQQLSEAIDCLLARLYVFKYTDEGTAQVFFWTAEFNGSPYEPDDEPTLDHPPLDPFGPFPVEDLPTTSLASPPAPAGEVAATSALPVVTEATTLSPNSAEYKAMQRMHERTGGKLRSVYEVMMREPLRVYGKSDEAFALLGDRVARAMTLGRMFGLGYIRRFKDPLDNSVAYYTIFGECPASLVEDTVQLSKAAQKRRKVAQEAADRQAQINNVKQDIEERKEGVLPLETEEDEDDEDFDPPAEESTEEVEPACYLSNTGELYIRRKNNTAVDLDGDESAAVFEVFLMMNPAALERLLQKQHARKAASE